MLLMGGSGYRCFAALLGVDEGELEESRVHITKLSVCGDNKWFDNPFLCSISDDRALLYFYCMDGLWYCEHRDTQVVMRKLNVRMPTNEGFCSLPIRLPDGRLLVAGGNPPTNDLTAIFPGESITFERIGSIPGMARSHASVVQARGFVIGVGGHSEKGNLQDVWVFDLRTCRGSKVREKGRWCPKGCWHPLLVHDGILYIISESIEAISLQTLAGLILEARVKHAFCREMGFPVMLGEMYTGRSLGIYIPTSL